MISWEQGFDLSENRTEYFRSIQQVKSPLILLPTELLHQLREIRTDDLSESTELYFAIATALDEIGSEESRSRAEFVRMQCKGEECKLFFHNHCESWGIPIFKEGILNSNDFEHGFLWCFRDHTSSWMEDYLARDWFYNSIESQFVRKWELWNSDNDDDELSYVEYGNYKEILLILANKYQDYEALKSGVLQLDDLRAFLNAFNSDSGDYYKDELIEDYVSKNPNWL